MNGDYQQFDNGREQFMQMITNQVAVTPLPTQNENPQTDTTQQQQTYGTGGLRTPAFNVHDMNNTFIDLDQSFVYVGDNSIFQKRITYIMSMQWVAFSFMVMGMTYIFRSPKFLCTGADGSTTACGQQIACLHMLIGDQKVEIQYPSQYSVVQQFDLICSREYLISSAQSLFFLGGLVSGYLLGYLNDRIGRRSVLIITMILASTSIIVCAVSQSFKVFMVGYFFCGFSLFGYETSIHIYISEMSGTDRLIKQAIRFRTISLFTLTMIWGGAPIFFPVMNLLPSWRWLFWILAIPLLASLPLMYKCFLESPRFLVSKKYLLIKLSNYQAARKIFRQISIVNMRPPYDFRLLEQIQQENRGVLHFRQAPNPLNATNSNELTRRRRRQAYNFLDLFRYKSLRRLVLPLMMLWLIRFFMYYAINLAMEAIVTSGFFLTIIIAVSSLVEVIGVLGPMLTTILFRMNKIDVMKISLVMTTICCALLWFIVIPRNCRVNKSTCPELFQSIALVMLIKFFISVFYPGLISYASEIFPTDVKAMSYGFTITFGRLGTVIVPLYINYMKVHYYDKNPLSFLAPWTLLGFVLCMFMPVSQARGLQQHVDQERVSNATQTEMRVF